MESKTSVKYFYYFRGSLATHIQFFEAWVYAVRERGMPMELITFLSPLVYLKQRKLIMKYKSPIFHIYIDTPYSILSSLFFFLCCINNKKVIVHLKKRSPKQFDKLKFFFPKRLKYIVEGEGDAVSEYDYLIKHPYKDGFYNNILHGFLSDNEKQKEIFIKADFLTFGYPQMKNMLISRYPDLGLDEKIILSPMSFKKGSLFFSTEIRKLSRQKLGLNDKLVLLYMGNAFYSWQNVFRSIEIFKLIKNTINANAFLILLIRNQDFEIVNDFIAQVGLTQNDYLLKNVDFNEINNYLNAADFGISLRHKHIMNETTPSAKILEYLGCGLPVITTSAMGEISMIAKNNNFGVVLENMDDDKEILKKLTPFLEISNERRNEISRWANNHLSTDANMDNYVNCLKKISSH